MKLNLLLFAIVLLIYYISSEWLRKRYVTAQMFFILAGFGLSLTGWVEVDFGNETLRLVGELALLFLLFNHALLMDLRTLRGQAQLPARLLAIGLPLTILLGTAAVLSLFSRFTMWEALLIGTVLAVVDNSILGQTTHYDARIPARIRQALVVESGLGHGLVLVLFIFFLALAQSDWQNQSLSVGLLIAGQTILVSLVSGSLFGLAGGWLIKRLPQQLSWLAAVAVALVAWFLTNYIGGSGFLAAYIAGLIIGSRFLTLANTTVEFADLGSLILNALLFFLLGMFILPAVENLTWQILLFAILSLTFIRILPVWLALSGIGLQRQTKLFAGWLGPRGIAAIVLGVIFILDTDFVRVREPIALTIFATVLLSAFIHGASGIAAVRHYGRFARMLPDETPEKQPVNDLPSYRIPLR